MDFDVLVIGGGAAGLMAAYSAGKCGLRVLVAERNNILGRKLRITGKGRCNVTNDCDINTLMKNIPRNGKFLYSAFSRFSAEDTKNFFEQRGVPLKTERGNRVFPVSDKAADIVGALVTACEENGVVFKTEQADKILVENGAAVGIHCKSSNEYRADKIILATGGKSYPLTGSDGSGYALAQEVGHTITAIRPSLVALVSKDECCGDMQGLSLKNVELYLYKNEDKKPLYSELGEMLFTHFGLSGPLVLSASAHIGDISKDKYYVKIDLKPGLDEQKLDLRIIRDFEKNKNKKFANSLDELLPRKLIPIIVMRSGINPLGQVNSITKEERRGLVSLIKGLKIEIDDFGPIDEAIITSGGVNVKEVNPKDMQSKLVRGLYFAGEILDVDGYTGGFNLQIAFSSGFAAGLSNN